MEQKKLFRRLHLSISSTYKILFSVSKRGGIVQLRPTLPISFLTRDQNNFGSDEFSSRKSFELRKNCCFAWIIMLLTLFLLNIIFAYVINIRLFTHLFMKWKRIAKFHFPFNTRIKPRFITVAYCNWVSLGYTLGRTLK